jgi:hypothetical protein
VSASARGRWSRPRGRENKNYFIFYIFYIFLYFLFLYFIFFFPSAWTLVASVRARDCVRAVAGKKKKKKILLRLRRRRSGPRGRAYVLTFFLGG